MTERSTSRVHRSNLEVFRDWCVRQGYRLERPTEERVVLQLRLKNANPVRVCDWLNSDYYVVTGSPDKFVLRFNKETHGSTHVWKPPTIS